MKGISFSFSPSRSVVFATVLVLIGLGAAYSFWYVPQQQEELEYRQFRYLQNIEVNIHKRIGNSLEMLNDWMNDYRANMPDYDSAHVGRYLKNFQSGNFRIYFDASRLKSKPKAKGDTTKQEKPKAGEHPSPKPVIVTEPAATSDTLVFVSDQTVIVRLHHEKVLIEIDYSLDQFFKPLLQSGMFDQYIVYREPAILYQTFPGGATGLVADSLKNDKSAFSNHQVKDIMLGGTAYKLFTQQLMLQGGTHLTVAGLLKSASYKHARNRIPGQLSIVLLIAVLLAILGLPWLKIYQMGGRDRLTAMDGILCLASPMLLVSVLIYAFLQFDRPLRSGTDGFAFGARSMAGQINKKFSREISAAYTVLVDGAASLDRYPVPMTGRNAGKPVKALLKALQKTGTQLSVNEFLRLDSGGREKFSWSPDEPPAPPGNYHRRSYFRQVHGGNPHYMGAAQEPYGLEPVISRVTGAFATVMCIPPKQAGGQYTAISFNLRCLQQTVLTPGFAFAIVDDTGKVLYHSDPARQLNENLFDECSDPAALQGALLNRTDTVLHADYSGKGYSFYTAPVGRQPFTLVIMEDNTISSARLNSQFFGCLALLAGFFSVLGLLLLLLFILSVKPLYYRKHYFDVSWIGPDDRFPGAYYLGFFANGLLLLLLLLAWALPHSFACMTLILLFAASLSCLFPNTLYAQYYRLKERDRYRHTMRGILWAAGAWAVIDIATVPLLQFYDLLFFQIASFLLLWVLSYCPTSWFTNTVKGYSMMTFSRLIITGALPVVLFFTTLYDFGLHLEARERQANFIRLLMNYGVTGRQELERQNIYPDQVWIAESSIVTNAPLPPADGPADKPAVALFTTLAGSWGETVPDAPGLAQPSADNSWVHSPVSADGDTTWYQLPKGGALKVGSLPIFYTLPAKGAYADNLRAVVFWAILVLAMTGLYVLFYDVVNRIFARNLPDDRGWDTIDDLLLETNKLNNLLFLIGPPGSGKLTTVLQRVNTGYIRDKKGRALLFATPTGLEQRYYVADMILIPNSSDDQQEATDAWNELVSRTTADDCALVVVNHFEYDIKNPASNRAKLGLLEQILQRNTAKLIVISTVHPVTFLDSLNAQQTTADASTRDAGTPEHDLERWHVLLGHFRIAVQSFRNSFPNADASESFRKNLQYETRTGKFLHALYRPLRKKQQELVSEGMKTASLLLKLGSTAQYFYNYIWQSLTREEKFLLYDLAEDGLVNSYDDNNLILLINKGLICKQHGVLRLFNEGFREFILTSIGPSEALQIQQTIRDNGNWNTLKPPLLLLLTAVLVFLFTSQKEAYTDILKYIAVITGGIPLVMQVFGLLRGGTKT